MKTLVIFKYAFLTIGIAMLAGALWLVQSSRSFVAHAVQAEGRVIDLLPSRSSTEGSVSYSPVVEFKTTEGNVLEFRSSVSSNPPGYVEGEKVTVLYPALRPQEARIKGYFSLWGGATIVGGIGSVFFLVGALMVWLPARAKKRAQWLMQHGTKLKTELQSVERNGSVSVNGQHPWCIVSQWKNPVTAELHIFKSANLWFDPSTHVPKGYITVYVDGTNTRRYHMDTSFLPRLAS